MLKEAVDGEFTTTDDVADAVLFFAGARSNALAGQSMVVSHGWCSSAIDISTAAAKSSLGLRRSEPVKHEDAPEHACTSIQQSTPLWHCSWEP